MRYTTDKNGKRVIDIGFYESIGVVLSDYDYPEKINGNLFAEYLLRVFNLVLRDGSTWYLYKKFYWQKLSDLQLKKMLYKHFNRLLDDAWEEKFEKKYWAVLMRRCKSSDDLISGEDYLNIKNGLYHMTGTGSLIPHDKRIFSTSQIPVSYDPDNPPDCPGMMDFLNDIFNSDQELIDLVQEIMGYCLSNSTKAHKLFIFYGHGRNGKSVLANVITALIGKENVTNITIKNFQSSFELADIVDKKLNISTESKCLPIQTDIIKAISAGDSIQINAKYTKPFSYTPTIKLIFAMNELPHTMDTSDGFIDRLCIIPFNNRYVHEPKNLNEKMIDPELTDKLIEELGGIFAFALKGLHRLVKNNYRFTYSKQAAKLLKHYRATINPYVNYVDTELSCGDNYKTKKVDVFNHFKVWARSQGYAKYVDISARSFYSAFEYTLHSKAIDIKEVKVRGVREYKGIQIKRKED